MNAVEKIETGIHSKSQLELLSQNSLEGQVIIHVVFKSCWYLCVGCKIEIYKDTYLQPDSSSIESKLIHILNKHSNLKFEIDGEYTHFSLVFSALPKSCKKFDFIEPGKEGWKLFNIRRNKTDVYNIQVHMHEVTLLKYGV